MALRRALRWRGGVVWCALAALAGCRAAPPQGAAVADRGRPATPAAAPPSYDWRGLILVPFGTLFKDSPLALHEVLLFHDAAQPAPRDGADCYALNGAAPPRFADQPPDAYLLCFDHDRLTRLKVRVPLPPDDAQRIFAAACAQWLADRTPPPDGADGCAVRAGATSIEAHLEAPAGRATRTMSIEVSSDAA
jgi:hypothetical protein